MPENSSINVDIKFPNIPRNTQEALRTVERGLQGIQGPLGRISGDFRKFDQSLEAANARVLAFGASVGVLYAVEKAFGSLIKTSINVEKTLKDINVILGTNQAGLKSFGNSLFKIANDTGQSFENVAEAAKEFSRQGLGVTETLQRTQDALILTRQAGLSAKDAVEDLTAAINTFGKAGLTSTQIINKFANVDAAFAVSSADLAEAIKRTGSVAVDAGVNIDELIGLVTSLQQSTARGGAVIGTSLKTIFEKIKRPEVLDQLEELGIQVRDTNGIQSSIKLLENLAKSYDDLTPGQQSFISSNVANLYQINQLKAGLADLSKENSNYQRAVSISSQSTNEAIIRNKELNESVAATINALQNNLKQLGSNIGESSVNPALKNIVGALNKGLTGLNDSLNAQDIGGQIGKGIIEGIGQFITGPGIGIVGLALAKLLGRAGGDSLQALNSILGNTQAIQSAVGRELAAGVPGGTIRLGASPILKSGSNPLGAGVYNTIDEPKGLLQGITRKRVPNFAAGDKSKYLSIQDQIYQTVDPDFYKKMAEASREGTEKGSSEALKKNLGRLLGQQIMGSAFGPVRPGQLYNNPFGTPLNQNPSSLQSRAATSGNPSLSLALGNQVRAGYIGSPLNQNPANLQFPQGSGPAIGPIRIAEQTTFPFKTKNPASNVTGGFDRLGPNVIPRTDELNNLLKEQQKITKEISKSLSPEQFAAQMASRQNAALGISIVAPIVGAVLKNVIGSDTRQQRGLGAAAESVGQIGSFAATGFFLGGGPQGAIAGGLLGLLTTLPSVFKAFNSVLPDLAKQLDLTKKSVTETSEDLDKFVSVTEQLKAINLGEVSAEPNVYKDLQKQKTEVEARIRNRNPDILKQLFDAQFDGNLGLTASKIKSENSKQLGFEQQRLQIASLLEKKKNIFGFGTDELIEDKNIKASVKRTLSLGQSGARSETETTKFGKKLSPTAQDQIGELSNFLSISQIRDGGTLGESISHKNELVDIISPDITKAKKQIDSLIPQLLNNESVKEDLDFYTKSILESLKIIFDTNKEVKELLDDLSKDSNSERKALSVRQLINNIGLTDDQIKETRDRNAEAESRQKKSRRINLVAGFDFDNRIRQNELDSFRTGLFNQVGEAKRTNFTELRLNQSNLAAQGNAPFISARGNLTAKNNLDVETAKSLSNLKINNIEKNTVTSLGQSKLNNLGQFIESVRSVVEDKNVGDEVKIARKKRIDDFQQTFGNQFDLQNPEITQKTLQEELNKLNNTKVNFEATRGTTTIDSEKEIDAKIKLYNQALTDLIKIQEDGNSKIEIEQDNLTTNLQKLSDEFALAQRQLLENQTAEGRARGTIFSGEFASNRNQILTDKLRFGEGYEPAQAITESFFNQWEYNIKDLYKDLQEGAADLSKTIKSSFSDTLKDLILGSKNAGEAFRNFGLTIANKIVGQSTDRTADLLFSGLGKLTGGALKFSSGGPVRGGSGTKDDVPAMLQAGEYVIKKSAVQSIGMSNLNRLNYDTGGSVGPLLNSVDSKTGKIAYDPRLSLDALEDSNNPQNARRAQLEDEYLSRLQYDSEKSKALRNFRNQRRTGATFALINAGIQGAALGYSAYNSQIPSNASASKSAFKNTYQTSPYQSSYGVTAANGGIIPRMYAGGGTVFGGESSKDNVPAMLMGGEYVVKKDVVDKYGKAYFDRLNRGGLIREGYADGGSVGLSNTNSTTPSSNDGINKLVIAINSLTDNVKKSSNPTTKGQSNGDAINITINMTDSTVKSENRTTKNSNQDQDTAEKANVDKRENLSKVADLIKSEVQKILINEKRAGGLLSTTPR